MVWKILNTWLKRNLRSCRLREFPQWISQQPLLKQFAQTEIDLKGHRWFCGSQWWKQFIWHSWKKYYVHHDTPALHTATVFETECFRAWFFLCLQLSPPQPAKTLLKVAELTRRRSCHCNLPTDPWRMAVIFFLCALWIGSQVRWSRSQRPSAEPWSTHRNSSRSVASHAAGSRPQSAGDWDDEAGGGSFQQQEMLYYRSEGQVLPIGVGVKPQVFWTLFCEFALILPHHFSTVATTSQLFAALLRPSSSHNSSQLLSSFSISSHLNSSRLFPPHLCPPLLTSCHLFSTPPISSRLVSTLLLLPPLFNLFSTLLNSSQLFQLSRRQLSFF